MGASNQRPSPDSYDSGAGWRNPPLDLAGLSACCIGRGPSSLKTPVNRAMTPFSLFCLFLFVASLQWLHTTMKSCQQSLYENSGCNHSVNMPVAARTKNLNSLFFLPISVFFSPFCLLPIFLARICSRVPKNTDWVPKNIECGHQIVGSDS